jgi:hypothetical protein
LFAKSLSGATVRQQFSLNKVQQTWCMFYTSNEKKIRAIIAMNFDYQWAL